MKTKPNYQPPGWLVVHWTRFMDLDTDRAQKFHDFRQRLCDKLGEDNQICNPTNLFRYALDLLMEHEATLLATVDNKPFEFPEMVKNEVLQDEYR